MNKPRLTGAEIALVTASLEIIKTLLIMISKKINGDESSNIDAMEQVLESMKESMELERQIKEAQDEIDKEDIDINDWINDSE